MLGWGYPPNIEGGLDIHVAKLFEELRARGVNVDLALPEENAPDKEGIIELDPVEGSMKDRARQMSGQIVEIAEDYDIIHTHDWFGSEAGFKAKKYSDCKWVSTFHSTCYSRSDAPGNDIVRLEKVAIEQADGLLAVSNILADEVEQNYDRRPTVIHNGISKLEVSGVDIKKVLGIENEMILYLGRLAEQKSVQLLINAFRTLDSDATLVIAGKGHMKGALEKFTAELGLSGNVVFTGRVPDEYLGDYFASADVFVSPSRNEPFGLTITEALGCGTPVVATENGAAEIVKEGLITVDHSTEALANGIRQALETKDFDMTGKSWEEVAEETTLFYRELESSTSYSSNEPGW